MWSEGSSAQEGSGKQMKRAMVLCFLTVWLSTLLPVGVQAAGLTAEGGFASRLLSHTESVFAGRVHNPDERDGQVLLVFAAYCDEKLQKMERRSIVLTGAETEICESVSIANERTTRLSAFLLENGDDLAPLYRGDVLTEEYTSPVSAAGTSSLETELGELPTEATLSERFPLLLTGLSAAPDQSTVNGLGVLAHYTGGGPGEVYVSVTHQTTNVAPLFEPFRTVRVLNPAGHVVCFYDFSAQGATDSVVLRVPQETEGGTWTISYTGGVNTKDDLTIGLQNTTDVYGIRGEMTLRIPARSTSENWYVYVPEKSTGCEIKSGGYAQGVRICLPAAEANDVQYLPYSAAEEALTEEERRSRLVWGEAETDAYGAWRSVTIPRENYSGYFNYRLAGYEPDSVWKVMILPGGERTLTFGSGIPGTLCPTPAAARQLAGGTMVGTDGKRLGGGVQTRARAAMLAHQNDNLAVELSFPQTIPDEISENQYDVEALLFASYGGIPGLTQALSQQNLDAESLYYGASYTSDNDFSIDLESFRYGGRYAMHQTLGFASLYALPTKLNAAYHNRALLTRSMLSAFCHFVALAPDGLLREASNNANQFWPMQHVFFIYPSLAGAYGLVKDDLTAEEAAVWRDGLILLGDKLSNFVCSQTNQWSEIVYGHLLAYQATGEVRFLRYFERAAASLICDNSTGAFRVLGQSSAGYFMESGGPGGSYQKLSMYNVVAAYQLYQRMPEANTALLADLQTAVERAVRFESLFYLTPPSGAPQNGLVAPTAMQTRDNTFMMTQPTYPGTYLAAVQFPLAKALTELAPGYGASTFAFTTVNHPELARARILAGLQSGTQGTTWQASWTPRLYEAFTAFERTTDEAEVPVLTENGVWDLNGVLAVKRNGFYVLHYYASSARTGYRSCLPTAVWTAESGAALLSMSPTGSGRSYSSFELEFTDNEGRTETVTSSCEQGTLTWNVPGESYTVTQTLQYTDNGAKQDLARLSCTTAFTDEGVSLSLSVTPLTTERTLTKAYAWLPVNTKGASAVGNWEALPEAAQESGQSMSLFWGNRGLELSVIYPFANAAGGEQPTLSAVAETGITTVQIQPARVPLSLSGETVVKLAAIGTEE